LSVVGSEFLQRPDAELETSGIEVEPSRIRPLGAVTNQPRASPWRDEKLALPCPRVHPDFIVRRGSPDPVGVRDRRSPYPANQADRRSPSPIVGPGIKGTCAPRPRSEGRRPSVRHSCGVRRPAHNKRSPKRNKSRGWQRLTGAGQGRLFICPASPWGGEK